MKFSNFLIKEIKRLQNELKLPYIRWTVSNEELKKRCFQLKKLTRFLDEKHKSFHSIKNRLCILEKGLKNTGICPVCSGELKTFGALTCSNKCLGKIYNTLVSETAKKEMIEKARKSRNYKEITKKRLETMKTDIDENGFNGFKRSSLKAIETMKNDIDENSINLLKRKGLKAKETIIENIGYEVISNKISLSKKLNYSPDKNHWNLIDEVEKEKRLKKQYESMRKTNESNGRWRTFEDLEDYEIYFKASSFKHGFKTENENEIKLLNEYGIFNNRTNVKGCVRDHLLSRRYGFENNIPSWIISHPANCEIVLHSENVRRSFTNDNLITLDELLKKIENWK